MIALRRAKIGVYFLLLVALLARRLFMLPFRPALALEVPYFPQNFHPLIDPILSAWQKCRAEGQLALPVGWWRIQLFQGYSQW